MNYPLGFIAGFALTALLVPGVKKFAFWIGAVDKVSTEERKIHRKPIARAGGLAIYLGFVSVSWAILGTPSRQFWGLVVAGTIVLLVGLADDVRPLNPWVKLCFHVFAALVASLMFGIGIEAVTNPFGEALTLTSWQWRIVFGPASITISLVATMLAIVWLVGMTNTMNLLDGLDGLSGGVAAIAAIIMFFLSVGPKVHQPETALISLVLAGSCLGYLIYNFYPAKIFNGDSGAYFLGMTIGILAIFSGAKLATAMLVLGLPIVDTIWAVVRRLASGRSPFSPDRGHIHHLLLDSGLSQRQAVLVIYAFSIVFGGIALVASSSQKLWAFIVLVLTLSAMIIVLTRLRSRRARLAAENSSL